MSASSRDRVVWADAAKGACIALVVLLHVTTKHFVQLGAASREARDTWLAITEWLRPIRMPLFFVISGYFAASSLRRPLRDVARKRIVQPYYLYVVWLVVQTLAIDLWLRPYVDSASWSGFRRALFLPSGNLWYLWALAVYFLVAIVVPARWRTGLLVLSAIATVLIASSWWTLGSRPTDLVQFAAYFLAGAIVPGAVRWVADSTTPLSAALVGIAFAAATWTVRAAEIGEVLGVTPALYVLGVCAGIGLAVVLHGGVADQLARLGRQTLPIYVMHVPVLMFWSWAIRRNGWRGAFVVPEAMWLYPLVLTPAIIAVTLGLHALLQRLGAWWLFSLSRAPRAPR